MCSVRVLRLIPEDAPLKKVWSALEAIIKSTRNRTSQLAILLAVQRLAHRRSAQHLADVRSTKVVVDAKADCSICRKRIATR